MPLVHGAEPAPPWLPELAEALAGQTIDYSPGTPPLRLRRHVSALIASDPYTRWGQVFLGERPWRRPGARPPPPSVPLGGRLERPAEQQTGKVCGTGGAAAG